MMPIWISVPERIKYVVLYASLPKDLNYCPIDRRKEIRKCSVMDSVNRKFLTLVLIGRGGEEQRCRKQKGGEFRVTIRELGY